MIAKCVALLAVVAQINAYVCNSGCATPVVASGCGATGIVGSGLVRSAGIVGSTGVIGSAVVGSGVVGSGVVGSGVVGSTVLGSGAVTGTAVSSRNIVAKGKYPVALDNTGPVPDGRVPVSTSHVQAPVQEKPTVRLSARIPAPRTVAHSCTCYKQILRPRVHDQYITVPTVQRYIETTHKPVVENIHYEAVPVNCPSTYGTSGVVVEGQVSPIASASSVGQVVPVSAAVETVSSGVEAVPVSSVYGVSPVVSSIQAVPVASAVQVASLPVRSGCECQSYCL